MDWASDLQTFLRQMFPPLPQTTLQPAPDQDEGYTAWVPTEHGEEPPF